MAAERGLSSLFLGVYKREDNGRTVTRIRHEGTLIRIGCFSTEADAARAYDIFAKAIKPPTWVCNFSTPEDYEAFRKLEASGSAPKDLFDKVTKKAEFFKEEQEEDCREAEIFGSKICLIADAAIELYEKEYTHIS